MPDSTLLLSHFDDNCHSSLLDYCNALKDIPFDNSKDVDQSGLYILDGTLKCSMIGNNIRARAVNFSQLRQSKLNTNHKEK